MNELKPCPFCGGACDIVRDEPISGAGFVECHECGARGGISRPDEAVRLWNTRAERTCHIVKTWGDSDYASDWRYRCSECERPIPVNERDPETGDVISAANYCPNCGAKVVSE